MSKHHNMWATHGECSCIKVMWFWIWWLCRFCVVIWVFHPCHNGQWPLTWKDLHPRSYPLHLFSYLNSWESASTPLFNVECQTREPLVPFWYDAVLDCGLNPGPPTLKVRILPLGYWGGLNSCDKKSITSLWLSERWYNDWRFLYLSMVYYCRDEMLVEETPVAVKHGDIIQLVHGLSSRALNRYCMKNMYSHNSVNHAHFT